MMKQLAANGKEEEKEVVLKNKIREVQAEVKSLKSQVKALTKQAKMQGREYERMQFKLNPDYRVRQVY